MGWRFAVLRWRSGMGLHRNTPCERVTQGMQGSGLWVATRPSCYYFNNNSPFQDVALSIQGACCRDELKQTKLRSHEEVLEEGNPLEDHSLRFPYISKCVYQLPGIIDGKKRSGICAKPTWIHKQYEADRDSCTWHSIERVTAWNGLIISWTSDYSTPIRWHLLGNSFSNCVVGGSFQRRLSLTRYTANQ